MKHLVNTDGTLRSTDTSASNVPQQFYPAASPKVCSFTNQVR